PEILSAQEQRSLSADDLGAKIANGLQLMCRSRQTVYVGDTENDVRQRVRDEMNRMGFRVMPQSAMAYGNPELVRTFLGEARLAVHFVGNQSSPHAFGAAVWTWQIST